MAIKLPAGFEDMLPADAGFYQEFVALAQCVFATYGYEPVITPQVELTDLFVRGIGEATDVVSKEMFTAISGENLATLLAGGTVKAKSRLTLRPEGTAGVVRAVVEHDLVPQGAGPVKLMYAGPMFRAERPQKGRLRQFNQIGIECLGAEAPSVDAEGIVMLMRFFRQVGIPQESMVLLLNSMGCDDCRTPYREAVRDFVRRHADRMCPQCLERAETNPLRAFDCKNEGCRAVMADAPRITDWLCESCRGHHDAVRSYLAAAGVDYAEDPTLVRGLDYYTRTVFEVQALDTNSAQNAIGGGGRYDRLAEEVGGRPTPGFGFALGFERCRIALEAAGVSVERPTSCDVFVATIEDAQRAAAFALVQRLRDAGVHADMNHQERSLKGQMKLANKLAARRVVVLGPDELAQGAAVVRDMGSHAERTVELDRMVEVLAAEAREVEPSAAPEA
ncbi:histidine--tRNA ligase [Eggerthellaceae bacterium zg-1084]|uniref:histidine--tRNA ligase n=1 Tax=Berryella wangjianweii TaxID=2734634 RepID=UPI0015573650|nr:histidine--tRNA ligase [Berryella wangjianweii]NPD31587.1 histidine--tRNA ligase [Berryella wangjianweii]